MRTPPFLCQQTRTSGTESYDQKLICPMVNLVQSLDVPEPSAQNVPFLCQQTRWSGTENYDQNMMWTMVNLVQSLDVT
jgi:hypothetical protein